MLVRCTSHSICLGSAAGSAAAPEPSSQRAQALKRLHVRVRRPVRGGWELSVVGQHLFERHLEFSQRNTPRYNFERGVYARSAWRF